MYNTLQNIAIYIAEYYYTIECTFQIHYDHCCNPQIYNFIHTTVVTAFTYGTRVK